MDDYGPLLEETAMNTPTAEAIARVITIVLKDTADGEVDMEITIDPPALPDENMSPASNIALRMIRTAKSRNIPITDEDREI